MGNVLFKKKPSTLYAKWNMENEKKINKFLEPWRFESFSSAISVDWKCFCRKASLLKPASAPHLEHSIAPRTASRKLQSLTYFASDWSPCPPSQYAVNFTSRRTSKSHNELPEGKTCHFFSFHHKAQCSGLAVSPCTGLTTRPLQRSEGVPARSCGTLTSDPQWTELHS